MKPWREMVNMPDRLFPVNIFIRSSVNEYVYVHPHWHDEFEILYILAGSARQQINERIFDICKGDVVVINGGDIHSTYTRRDMDNTILVLQFDLNMMKPANICSPEKKHLDRFIAGIDYPNPLRCEDESQMEILKPILDIHNEFDEKKEAFELLVKARIYELAGLLTRNYGHLMKKLINAHQIARAKEMLQNTFKFIDDNYSSDITLLEAAKISNLSISHFCRLFKKSTGLTFTDYLSLYRVNRAEDMLTSSRSVTDISFECGFNNVTSFIRAFKKHKKCTPSSFRKKT